MAQESRIRVEIGQRRPFRSCEQECVVALLRTGDVVRHSVSRLLEPLGVTLQQYNVLRILRGAAPEPLPTLDIAERMLERAPGITRLLDRLERRGLVRRVRCPEDRRRVLVSITTVGLELLGRAEGPLQRAHRDSLAMLRPAQLAALNRLLDAVRAGHEPARGLGPRAARPKRSPPPKRTERMDS